MSASLPPSTTTTTTTTGKDSHRKRNGTTDKKKEKLTALSTSLSTSIPLPPISTPSSNVGAGYVLEKGASTGSIMSPSTIPLVNVVGGTDQVCNNYEPDSKTDLGVPIIPCPTSTPPSAELIPPKATLMEPLSAGESLLASTITTLSLSSTLEDSTLFLSVEAVKHKFKKSDFTKLIRLNVGGERFSTCIGTIINCPHERDSLLQALCESIDELPKDEKDCPFIDRDPKYFRHILNWFRAPELPVVGDMVRQNLLKEAQFFQMRSMTKALTSSESASSIIPEPSVDQLQILLTIGKMRTALPCINLSGLNLSGLRLVGLEMKGAWFYETTLVNTQFCYSNLSQAKFIKSQLEGTDFSYTDLTSANFSNANMRGIIFRGSKLAGATMTHTDLTGVDFSNLNLSGICFQGANLSKANFTRSILSSCNLQSANLTSAVFTGANLDRADLSLSTMKATNFTKANLQFANLQGALLNATVFSHADLTAVKLPDDLKKKCVLTGVKY